MNAHDVNSPPRRRFNDRFGIAITNVVGTMWCAYAFAAIAFMGLPQALQQSFPRGGSFSPLPLVQWIAQTFLQLVLLSVIIVGQNLQGAKAETRDQETHDAVMQELAILHDKHDDLHDKVDRIGGNSDA